MFYCSIVIMDNLLKMIILLSLREESREIPHPPLPPPRTMYCVSDGGDIINSDA